MDLFHMQRLISSGFDNLWMMPRETKDTGSKITVQMLRKLQNILCLTITIFITNQRSTWTENKENEINIVRFNEMQCLLIECPISIKFEKPPNNWVESQPKLWEIEICGSTLTEHNACNLQSKTPHLLFQLIPSSNVKHFQNSWRNNSLWLYKTLFSLQHGRLLFNWLFFWSKPLIWGYKPTQLSNANNISCIQNSQWTLRLTIFIVRDISEFSIVLAKFHNPFYS